MGSWQSIPLLGQQQSPLLTLATKQNTTNKFANLQASHSSGDQTLERGTAPLLFPKALQGFLRMGLHLPFQEQRFLPTQTALANLKPEHHLAISALQPPLHSHPHPGASSGHTSEAQFLTRFLFSHLKRPGFPSWALHPSI